MSVAEDLRGSADLLEDIRSRCSAVVLAIEGLLGIVDRQIAGAIELSTCSSRLHRSVSHGADVLGWIGRDLHREAVAALVVLTPSDLVTVDGQPRWSSADDVLGVDALEVVQTVPFSDSKLGTINRDCEVNAFLNRGQCLGESGDLHDEHSLEGRIQHRDRIVRPASKLLPESIQGHIILMLQDAAVIGCSVLVIEDEDLEHACKYKGAKKSIFLELNGRYSASFACRCVHVASFFLTFFAAECSYTASRAEA